MLWRAHLHFLSLFAYLSGYDVSFLILYYNSLNLYGWKICPNVK